MGSRRRLSRPRNPLLRGPCARRNGAWQQTVLSATRLLCACHSITMRMLWTPLTVGCFEVRKISQFFAAWPRTARFGQRLATQAGRQSAARRICWMGWCASNCHTNEHEDHILCVYVSSLHSGRRQVPCMVLSML